MGKIISIFLRDLKRVLRNPVAVVVTLGVCVIPSLYAWFNIAANWDPYENTQDIRVAVVNLDRGFDVEGQGYVNAGDEVVEALAENDQLAWTFTDKDDAVAGVRSGTYYAALVIPEDFTQGLASVTTGELGSPTITYYVNEKANAVAPKVTDAGATTIEQQINSEFMGVASEVVAGRAAQLGASLVQGADLAATEAADRVDEVEGLLDELDGLSSSVDDSVGAARRSIADSRDALSSLRELVEGADTSLADATRLVGTARADSLSLSATLNSALTQGATQLGSASASANVALARLLGAFSATQGSIDGAIEVASDVADANSRAVESLREAYDLLPPEQQALLADLISRLESAAADGQDIASALETASADAHANIDSAQGLSDAVNDAVQTGTGTLTGVQSTLSGTTLTQMGSSLDSLSAASADISRVLATLDATLVQAEGLLDQLDSTLSQLEDIMGTADGAAADVRETLGSVSGDLALLRQSVSASIVSDLLDVDVTTVAEAMSSPVTLRNEVVFPVRNYGSGVAPFYTNLALWVGGFVLIAIYKLEVDDEGIGRFKPWQGFFGRWLLLAALGQLQAIVCCVGDLVLGIQCLHPATFILAGMVASLVYVTVIFSMSIAFKHIGKALCVLLVILQIPGSSGTYPIEMMPGFFKALNPFLPFRYGINAMRESIAGYYGASYVQDLALLLLFVIPALLVGIAARRHLINVNALFDRELAKTDLMICEPHPFEQETFRTATLVKALLEPEAYRKAVDGRARRFDRAYPLLVARGYVAFLAVPAALFAALLAFGQKLPILSLWIVSLVATCAYLIVLEYHRTSVRRRARLARMSRDEVMGILDRAIEQETLPFVASLGELRNIREDTLTKAAEGPEAKHAEEQAKTGEKPAPEHAAKHAAKPEGDGGAGQAKKGGHAR